MDTGPQDWIEGVLRRDAAEHASDYLHDDGFSAKVIAALPPPVNALPRWRKPAVLTMWGLAATGVAVALPEVAINVGREAYRLLAAQPVSFPQIAATLALLGFATWAAAAYALRQE